MVDKCIECVHKTCSWQNPILCPSDQLWGGKANLMGELKLGFT